MPEFRHYTTEELREKIANGESDELVKHLRECRSCRDRMIALAVEDTAWLEDE